MALGLYIVHSKRLFPKISMGAFRHGKKNAQVWLATNHLKAIHPQETWELAPVHPPFGQTPRGQPACSVLVSICVYENIGMIFLGSACQVPGPVPRQSPLPQGRGSVRFPLASAPFFL